MSESSCEPYRHGKQRAVSLSLGRLWREPDEVSKSTTGLARHESGHIDMNCLLVEDELTSSSWPFREAASLNPSMTSLTFSGSQYRDHRKVQEGRLKSMNCVDAELQRPSVCLYIG